MGGIYVVATVFVSIIALTELSEAIAGSEEFGNTRCERRLLSKKYPVTKVDSKGLQCWGWIDVLSCIGHCESAEILNSYYLYKAMNLCITWYSKFTNEKLARILRVFPTLRFPYKESRHHTCIDDGQVLESALIENCDPGVEEDTKWYNYLAPRACKCAPCNPGSNSCLNLRKRTMLPRSKFELSYPMKPESMQSTGFKNQKEWASNLSPPPQYQVYYV